MWTALFWKDTAERVITSIAEAVLALWAVDAVDIDWGQLEATGEKSVMIGIAVGVLTLLKCIVVAGRANTISPASAAKPPDPPA